MVWLFEREAHAVRVETRYDRESSEYVLLIHRRDGSQIERFENEVTFRNRLETLEQQFDSDRWRRTGPFLLRDGWRL
jgi:hypothetical protein